MCLTCGDLDEYNSSCFFFIIDWINKYKYKYIYIYIYIYIYVFGEE